MTYLEYAQQILDEFRPGLIARDIAETKEPLGCIILCEEGKSTLVNGKWAIDMLRLKRQGGGHDSS